MKNVDFIIVGDGYASMFFAHELIKQRKTFRLFSGVNYSASASTISAGIVNPVVLKKFTTFWLAIEQIQNLRIVLNEIEEYTCENYWVAEPIKRVFHNKNEKDLWLKKANDDDLKCFLSPDIKFLENIQNPFGVGEVLLSGRLKVASFFSGMLKFLEKSEFLVKEKFDYDLLNAAENCYRDVSYNNIIFCEGSAISQNPYFSNIPIHPNKGHQLVVQFSENFELSQTIKKKHFLFPLDEDSYYYGGTYDRDADNLEIDDNAVQQLVSGLKEITDANFDIKTVNTAFRPTVNDRRPIIGSHSEFKNLFVFNGLGARGILNGSYFSKHLFDFIEYQKPLPREVDLQRFQSL